MRITIYSNILFFNGTFFDFRKKDLFSFKIFSFLGLLRGFIYEYTKYIRSIY